MFICVFFDFLWLVSLVKAKKIKFVFGKESEGASLKEKKDKCIVLEYM